MRLFEASSIPTNPVILVTGDYDVIRTADPIKDGYPTLPKPVEPAKLRALLHHVLMMAQNEQKGSAAE